MLFDLSRFDFNDPVIQHRKPADQAAIDTEEGKARLGGMERHPIYCEAYILAARTLLDSARAMGQLDQMALPIFLLQRHAMELLLKGHLESGIKLTRSMGSMRTRRSWLPDSALLAALGQHKLDPLRQHLVAMVDGLLGMSLPVVVDEAVRLIEETETMPTWSRYASDRRVAFDHDPRSMLPRDTEIAIPLATIQDKLEGASQATQPCNPCNEGESIGDLIYSWLARCELDEPECPDSH